jgi:hypothetical protein
MDSSKQEKKHEHRKRHFIRDVQMAKKCMKNTQYHKFLGKSKDYSETHYTLIK